MRWAIFQAIEHRDFRIFLFGQIFSLVGMWAQRMAQSWLVYELTGSAAWLGIVEATMALPLTFLALVGGSFADRVRKRRLLIANYIVSLVFALTYALLIWQDWINMHLILVMALIYGVLLAFEVPTRQSFYTEMVGKRDLTNAIALNSATFSTARLLGPAVGGILVAHFGVAWCMFINGISYLSIIASLLLIRHEGAPVRAQRKRPLWKSLLQLWVYVRSSRQIMGLYILIATETIFGWSYTVILPVIASEMLGGGALELGHLMSASGLGTLVAAFAVATLSSRVLPRRLIFNGLTAFIAGLILLALSRSLEMALAASALSGFGLVMFYVNANSSLQRRVPDALRGRVMGGYALAFGGLMPVGSLQVGLVSEHFGVRTALLLGTAVLIAVSLIIARWVPSRLPVNGNQ